MTSPNSTTGWNSTAGSNLSNYPQGTLGGTTVRGGGKEGNMTRAQLKKEYFETHYDYLTGVRIASTLGGFFALVLLILLYKSKCKKNSCASTPVIPVDVSLIGQHPAATSSNGFVHGDEEEEQLSMSLTLIDSPYMNQIHHKSFMSPAVLLTAANSESSEDEDNVSLGGSRAEIRLHHGGLHHPQLPPKSQKYITSNVHLNPACSSNYLNPSSPPLSAGKKKRLQQNIDINVILPTPTISPSGSENFCTRVHKEPTAGGRPDGSIPIPVPMVRSRVSERERSRTNSFGADSASNQSYSCSYNGNGGGGANPLFFLDNLKYVDDTSSENIPTRASDFEDQDQDTRSIGSDSVFAYFEHNFDHVAPLCSSEGVSVSGLTVASGSNGKRRVSIMSGSGTEDDDCECRVILTQAQAQVHHRESFCSELESLNDYLESRRRSSSTQTTTSDLRQCLSFSSATSPPNFPPQSQIPSPSSLSSAGGKLSPKPLLSPPKLSVAPPPVSTNPHFGPSVVTVFGKHKDRDDSPSASPANPSVSPSSNSALLLAVNRHPPPTKAKKRNFPPLKKTFSLQCDEPLTVQGNCPVSPTSFPAHPFQLSPPPTPTTPLHSDNDKECN